VPTFPNARYLFARKEWEHWRVAEWRAAYTTDPYYEDSLLPVMESGQAELVATDYAFDDGVRIETWPGHTPGHVCGEFGTTGRHLADPPSCSTSGCFSAAPVVLPETPVRIGLVWGFFCQGAFPPWLGSRSADGFGFC